MEIGIAKENFDLLSTFEGQKLFVDKGNNKLHVDGRWFQSIRRGYTGDSKQDILEPIRMTVECMKENHLQPNAKIVECVQHMTKSLSRVYPDFPDLDKLLVTLLTTMNTTELRDEYLELEKCQKQTAKLKKKLEQKTTDLQRSSQNYKKVAFDLEALNSKFIITREKDAKTINDLKHKIQELKTTLDENSDKDNRINDLKHDLKQVGEKRNILENYVRKAQSEREKCASDLDKWKSKSNALQVQIEKLNNELVICKKYLQDEQKQVDGMAIQITVAKDNYSILSEEKETIEQKYANQIEQHERENNEHREKYDKLSKYCQELEHELEKLATERDELEVKFVKERNVLKQQLIDSQSTQEDTVDKLNLSKLEKGILSKQVENMKNGFVPKETNSVNLEKIRNIFQKYNVDAYIEPVPLVKTSESENFSYQNYINAYQDLVEFIGKLDDEKEKEALAKEHFEAYAGHEGRKALSKFFNPLLYEHLLWTHVDPNDQETQDNLQHMSAKNETEKRLFWTRHFLNVGCRQNYPYIPLDFDAITYLCKYEDLYQAVLSATELPDKWALRHYVFHGFAEGRSYTDKPMKTV